jgi:hypothetical protein
MQESFPEDVPLETIADWFEAGIDRSAEQLLAVTLLGTLAIAHYQVGKARFEPMAAAMLTQQINPTDDMPVKRGIHLYDIETEAVNYVEQQVGGGNPIIWLEELSPGTQRTSWSGNIFGDVKTLALDVITGRSAYGQQVDAVEIESWNTILLRSLPVDADTAQLALYIAKQQDSAYDGSFEPPEITAARKQLSMSIKTAIKRASRDQKRHGIA